MSSIAGFAVYENGIRVTDVTLEQVTQLKWGKDRFVWIGLHEPDAEAFRQSATAVRAA